MVLRFQRPQVFRGCKFLIGTALTASVAVLLTTTATSVQAVTFVTDRASLNETDRVDWSGVGAVFNPLGPPDPSVFLPSLFDIRSEAGLGVQVTIPEDTTPGLTPPFVFQTTPAPGIETNFGNGDFILFTGFIPGPPPATGNAGPITLTFDTPVRGAGAQIGVDDTFNFTGTLSAFGENDALLGSFSTLGTSSLVLDNTALFLGVFDDSPTISKLEFQTSVPGRAVGLNQLSLVTEAASVPEPSMGLAMAVIMGGGLLVGNAQRKTNHA